MAHPRLVLGIGADVLTFVGALLLARDGFQRLKEVNATKVDQRIRKEFPNVNFVDTEATQAKMSEQWAWRGFVILLLGFALQIIVRIMED